MLFVEAVDEELVDNIGLEEGGLKGLPYEVDGLKECLHCFYGIDNTKPSSETILHNVAIGQFIRDARADCLVKRQCIHPQSGILTGDLTHYGNNRRHE